MKKNKQNQAHSTKRTGAYKKFFLSVTYRGVQTYVFAHQKLFAREKTLKITDLAKKQNSYTMYMRTYFNCTKMERLFNIFI